MMYEEVIRDFALRTRKNLEAIETLQRLDAGVFKVTQLINSMLGLLVFPQQEYVESIPRIPLEELHRRWLANSQGYRAVSASNRP